MIHTPTVLSHANPIGVFDSGVGGLSVLKALLTELPLERFIYVADSGHAPYGERDDTHVIARSHAITDHLIRQHHIKALVVACNTATAAAINRLRQDFPQLPIVGIEPALKPAAAQTKTGRIGVMATRGTLNSEKFRSLLETVHGKATFVLQPCDGLADAIEQADATKIVAYSAMYTRALGQFGTQPEEMDALVLGCTHYPFVSDTLRDLVGADTAFFEGGAPVARQTRRILGDAKTLAIEHSSATSPTTHFYSSGSPEKLRSAVARWLGMDIELPMRLPV